MRKTRYVVKMDGSDTEIIRRLKLEAISRYGGKCYFCEESDPDVLVLRPKRSNGENGTLFWVRAHGYPARDERGTLIHLTCGNCIIRGRVVT